jgi:hypothetical protein
VRSRCQIPHVITLALWCVCFVVCVSGQDEGTGRPDANHPGEAGRWSRVAEQHVVLTLCLSICCKVSSSLIESDQELQSSSQVHRKQWKRAISIVGVPDVVSVGSPPPLGSPSKEHMAARLEQLESKYDALVGDRGGFKASDGMPAGILGECALDADQLTARAFKCIRSELALKNMTLKPGGMRQNTANFDATLKEFGARMRSDGLRGPPDTLGLFRDCFRTVVKSERRRSDPTQLAKCMKVNLMRQMRWRLCEKMRSTWGVISECYDAARRNEGCAILEVDYMPEIHLSAPKTLTYTNLLWLSEKAKSIHSQIHKCLQYDARSYKFE